MSGFCASSMAGADPSSAFLILASLTAVGRKSAGAAAITTASAVAVGGDDRLAQLLGRLDAYDVDAGRVGQGHVGADEGDVGAPRGRGPGEGVALEPGGPVAEEPDRVEVLPGAAGGDDHLATGEVLGDVGAAVEQPAHQLVDLGGLRQPALAGVGAGEAADGGLDDDRPALAEGGDVGLRGRVLPHLGVHRRGEDHRAARGEERVGEEVVGQAVRRAGEQVGGRRCDHDHVGLLADVDVGHGVDVGPHVGGDGLARQGGPRRGADELQRRRPWARR